MNGNTNENGSETDSLQMNVRNINHSDITRTILADKPRVTHLQINWDADEQQVQSNSNSNSSEQKVEENLGMNERSDDNFKKENESKIEDMNGDVFDDDDEVVVKLEMESDEDDDIQENQNKNESKMFVGNSGSSEDDIRMN